MSKTHVILLMLSLVFVVSGCNASNTNSSHQLKTIETVTQKQHPSRIDVLFSNKNSYEVSDSLKIRIGKKEFLVIDFNQKIPQERFNCQDNDKNCFEYMVGFFEVDKRDYDNDGYVDHLLAFTNGGNACPPKYAFLSIFPDGSSNLTNLFAECSNAVEYQAYEGKNTYLFTDYPTGKTTRYYLKDGKAESIVGARPSHLIGLDELDFETQKLYESMGSEIHKKWDLNHDGFSENLDCRVVRSGISCTLTSSQSKRLAPFLENLIIKRLAISKSKTLGYSDLIIGENSIASWNGNEYVEN